VATMMKKMIKAFALLSALPFIDAHGFMVRPAIWSDTNKFLWATDKNGDSTDIGCGNFDLPDDTEFEINNGNKLDCQQWWSTVGTEIPGEANFLIDQIRPDIDCSEENTEELHQKFPWSAPGTAPVVSPCGAMGGYPYGCSGAEKFGDVCPCDGEGRPSEIFGCGSFAFGGLAHQYQWPNAPITEWKAGSVEKVAWWLPSPSHGGGYSYRLCKTPAEGKYGLTEECFQNGHLEFFGDEQWIFKNNEYLDSEPTKINATRINKGTFPPGSMWTFVPFHYPDRAYADQSLPEVEDQPYFGHVIDQIKVPCSLEPGEYVLSFRWDCKCTSQVFNTCANIQIT